MRLDRGQTGDSTLIDATRYGPWAVVAGGSEGVGAAFARQLAAAGVSLVLLARKPEPLEEIAGEIRALGTVSVRTLSVDLAADGAADRVKALTADLEVGLLVYNAGADGALCDFIDRDIADATRTIARNITVPTILTHHYATQMRVRGKGGGIILVGAVGGYAGGPGMSMYSASKAFDYILAEGLWYEFEPLGIDVLGLVLGATDTPALARIGMKIDTPGFVAADSASVAREGLDHLGRGPVWHTGGTESAAQYLRTMPRAEAVALIAEASKAMMKR
jgi:short-subunit dehydrogenase